VPNFADILTCEFYELVVRENSCRAASHRQGRLLNDNEFSIKQLHLKWMERLGPQVLSQSIFKSVLVHANYCNNKTKARSSKYRVSFKDSRKASSALSSSPRTSSEAGPEGRLPQAAFRVLSIISLGLRFARRRGAVPS
jgi:hypothetical protein